MLTHMNASQNDPIKDAVVRPPENCMPLVTTNTTGNSITVKIAMPVHSLAAAWGIASIHPSLYATMPEAKSMMY